MYIYIYTYVKTEYVINKRNLKQALNIKSWIGFEKSS